MFLWVIGSRCIEYLFLSINDFSLSLLFWCDIIHLLLLLRFLNLLVLVWWKIPLSFHQLHLKSRKIHLIWLILLKLRRNHLHRFLLCCKCNLSTIINQNFIFYRIVLTIHNFRIFGLDQTLVIFSFCIWSLFLIWVWLNILFLTHKLWIVSMISLSLLTNWVVL